MAVGYFSSASIFFMVFGVDDQWTIIDTEVPTQLMPVSHRHQVRGIFDLPDAVIAGLDLSSPVDVKLTISPPLPAILWFDYGTTWMADANGVISFTLDSSQLTAGGTLPGRFLLEIGSDFPVDFTYSWGVAPTVPISLVAVSGNATVVLTWSASTGNGPITYNVKRSDDLVTWTTLTNTALLTYTDNTVVNGNVYYYEVTAVNPNAESAPSNIVQGRPNSPPPGLPAAPAWVTGTWTNTTAYIDWDISDSVHTATYNIYGSADNITFSLLGSVSSAPFEVTQAMITTAGFGTTIVLDTLYVKVGAANGTGESVSTAIAIIGLKPPTAFTATPGDTTVALSWTDPVTGFTPSFYDIAVYEGLSQVAVVPASGTSHTVTSLVNGIKYTFYLYAIYADGTQSFPAGPLDATPQSATGPVITVQPADVTVADGGSATFSVTATGSSLTYQWYFSGTSINGATSSSVTINPVHPPNAGTYAVIVANAFGNVLSRFAVLTVSTLSPPVITTQPVSITVIESDSASISVGVSGSNTMHYQWYFNSAPVASGTNATLTIAKTTKADEGTYYCVIANNQGPGQGGGVTTSVSVQIKVNNIFNYLAGSAFDAFTVSAFIPPDQGTLNYQYYLGEIDSHLLEGYGLTITTNAQFHFFYLSSVPWILQVTIGEATNTPYTGSGSLGALQILANSILWFIKNNVPGVYNVSFPATPTKARLDFLCGNQVPGSTLGGFSNVSHRFVMLSHPSQLLSS